MQHDDKVELARELLNNLYDSVFSDEARILSLLSVPSKSPEAMIDEMANSVRYIGLSILKDKLRLGGMDKGVPDLIDNLESRSKRRMRELASDFLLKDMSFSDMLRPGRKV